MLDRSRQHLAFLVCSLSLILAVGGSLLPMRANTSRVRAGRSVRAGQTRIAGSLRDCDAHLHTPTESRESAAPDSSRGFGDFTAIPNAATESPDYGQPLSPPSERLVNFLRAAESHRGRAPPRS
jgi:hypothetical protein